MDILNTKTGKVFKDLEFRKIFQVFYFSKRPDSKLKLEAYLSKRFVVFTNGVTICIDDYHNVVVFDSDLNNRTKRTSLKDFLSKELLEFNVKPISRIHHKIDVYNGQDRDYYWLDEKTKGYRCQRKRRKTQTLIIRPPEPITQNKIERYIRCYYKDIDLVDMVYKRKGKL